MLLGESDFSKPVFSPFPGVLMLAPVSVLHLLPTEDGKGWPQGGSQAQTAEGVIYRALQKPLFGLEAAVTRAALFS